MIDEKTPEPEPEQVRPASSILERFDMK